MKLFTAVATLLVAFGCGILSAIFGLPERYIERDVTADEIAGTWNVTSDSEAAVDAFVKEHPDFGALAPWKTIIFNGDGSCKVNLEIGWLSSENGVPVHWGGEPYSKDVITNNMTSCSWNIKKEENPSGKVSPILALDFEYPHNNGMRYSLYIFEEKGQLVLWDFIGDPDDFHPQDFVKTKQ